MKYYAKDEPEQEKRVAVSIRTRGDGVMFSVEGYDICRLNSNGELIILEPQGFRKNKLGLKGCSQNYDRISTINVSGLNLTG